MSEDPKDHAHSDRPEDNPGPVESPSDDTVPASDGTPAADPTPDVFTSGDDSNNDAPAARRRVVVGSVRSPEEMDERLSSGGSHSDRDPSVEDTATAASADTPQLRGRASGSPNRFLRGLKEVAIIGVIALFISFLIKTFIAQAFWIPTGSMEQTLIRGDRVVVSKITAGPLAVERGDIAVFEDPGGWLPPTQPPDYGAVLNPVVDGLEFVGLMPSSDGSHLIKRVIGVGGDHIVCCDDHGRITVNGQPLEETYLFPGDVPSLDEFDVVVPEDHYWMMGDHRSNSRDSRHHDDGSGNGGAVPADRMVGRSMVLIWPVNRLDWFDGARDVFADVPDSPPTQ